MSDKPIYGSMSGEDVIAPAGQIYGNLDKEDAHVRSLIDVEIARRALLAVLENPDATQRQVAEKRQELREACTRMDAFDAQALSAEKAKEHLMALYWKADALLLHARPIDDEMTRQRAA